MADEAAATILRLQAELDAAPTRREKKALRQKIAMQKQVEGWLGSGKSGWYPRFGGIQAR
jgi:hypothetical protein